MVLRIALKLSCRETTKAGRRLVELRSVNGKGTTTTSKVS